MLNHGSARQRSGPAPPSPGPRRAVLRQRSGGRGPHYLVSLLASCRLHRIEPMIDPLQRAQTEQRLSQNLLTGVRLPDLHEALHAATAPASSTHDTGRSPIVHFCVGERWKCVDFSRSIVARALAIVCERWKCADFPRSIVVWRCRSLPEPGNRWLALPIVGDFQESLAVAGKKSLGKFSGARPGDLQQSVLGGLRASSPVGLAGKPVWRTCLQITRTPLPARYVRPTRGGP